MVSEKISKTFLLSSDLFTHAEVRELGVALAGQHHILRLDVSMDDTLG